MDGYGINNNEDIKPLSDYTFLERSVHEVYIWIWFILHVWRCDRFSALSWKRVRSLELKSFVTIFILFALPLGSFYDIVSTRIKYIEGFYLFAGVDGVVGSKPKWLWSEKNKMWFLPSYYILMVGIGFQIITLFLLQCFWNYLVNSIAKYSFMSRLEFSLYIVWGIICVGIFPVLPYLLKDRDALLEVLPQLIYAAQLMILALLGIRTHCKFIRLIQITASYKNYENINAKIRYFIDMNKLLTASLAIMAVAFLLLSIDILTSTKIINNSKFASDLLVAHINFATIIEWLALILIFYPRKGFVGTKAGGSSFNTNITNNNSNINSNINSNMNSVTVSSNMINSKYSNNNVPHGRGSGLSNANLSIKTNSFNNNNNEYRQNLVQPKPLVGDNFDSNSNESRHYLVQQKPSVGDSNVDKTNNLNNNNNNNNNNESSLIRKLSRSKKKSADNTSDHDNDSDNEEKAKALPHLKRNISISRDGKMLYGETKPLGKVKGAEFVAVEKADPSFIPSYYFTNEIRDRNANVHRIPSIIKNIDDPEGGNSVKQGIHQDISKDVVQGGAIVQQEGIVQGIVMDDHNDQDFDDDDDDDDDDDGYFYAM